VTARSRSRALSVMRLLTWRKPESNTFSDHQRLLLADGFPGPPKLLLGAGGPGGTGCDSWLFEGLGDGPRHWEARSSKATGSKEGSAHGQVEKAEDFGQIQPEDEIRCQKGSDPRRPEGSHHNLGQPRRKHQRLQAHGAGYRNGQCHHLVQERHTRVPRRGGGKGVSVPPEHRQLEFHPPQALVGCPYGRDRGRLRRREQERQEELELRRTLTDIGGGNTDRTLATSGLSSGSSLLFARQTSYAVLEVPASPEIA